MAPKHSVQETVVSIPSPDNGDYARRPADGVAASPLLRGLSILEAFLNDETTLSVGDLSQMLGMHKSTVSRMTRTLEGAGYLERDPGDGRYSLGSRLAALGARVAPLADLRQLARPALLELRDICGETVHLGVREGTEVVTIDIVEGTHTIRMHTTVGKRSPVQCSAMGKAILALLPESEVATLREEITFTPRTPHTCPGWEALLDDLATIRVHGFALDEQELLVGLSCVGASLVNQDGAPVAAISISGPSDRITATGIEWLSKRVSDAANKISSRLGAPTSRATRLST